MTKPTFNAVRAIQAAARRLMIFNMWISSDVKEVLSKAYGNTNDFVTDPETIKVMDEFLPGAVVVLCKTAKKRSDSWHIVTMRTWFFWGKCPALT